MTVADLIRAQVDALREEMQRAELDRRVAEDDAFPDDVIPWEDIKNLSVNNVYLEMHFAQRDDASCKMVECEEAALKLLIAHQ